MNIEIKDNKNGQVYNITLDDLKNAYTKEWYKVVEMNEQEYCDGNDWKYDFEDEEDLKLFKQDAMEYLIENLEYYWNKYSTYCNCKLGCKPIYEILEIKGV